MGPRRPVWFEIEEVGLSGQQSLSPCAGVASRGPAFRITLAQDAAGVLQVHSHRVQQVTGEGGQLQGGDQLLDGEDHGPQSGRRHDRLGPKR